jgi:hypothetical protein
MEYRVGLYQLLLMGAIAAYALIFWARQPRDWWLFGGSSAVAMIHSWRRLHNEKGERSGRGGVGLGPIKPR